MASLYNTRPLPAEVIFSPSRMMATSSATTTTMGPRKPSDGKRGAAAKGHEEEEETVGVVLARERLSAAQLADRIVAQHRRPRSRQSKL
uniref:Uncharacterized protein n=1 Tax=Lotharella oceanica TaxID=641309 RepID=A0A7S2TZ84_9EUKA